VDRDQTKDTYRDRDQTKDTNLSLECWRGWVQTFANRRAGMGSRMVVQSHTDLERGGRGLLYRTVSILVNSNSVMPLPGVMESEFPLANTNHCTNKG
jgi:hypothetical protein